MRKREKRSTVAWALLLLVLVVAMAGEIAAGSGTLDPQASRTVSGGGGAPDTLYGGPGGSHTHGDPDDFDRVIPLDIWIQSLLIAIAP